MTTTKFNCALLDKYSVATLTDFAYLMYDYKLAGNEAVVEEMALALTDAEAIDVANELTTLLFWDALDNDVTEASIIKDFKLNRSPK